MNPRGYLWELPCAKVDYTPRDRRSRHLTGYTKNYMLSIAPELVPAVALVLFFIMLARMRPRRFYFIRHSETVLNAEHIRQGEAGGLSEHGRAQADRLGQALAPLRIKCMITSSYDRAKETAAIMNKHLHAPLLVSTLFIERRNPSEIVGKGRDLPEVVHIVDQIENAYHKDDYRYSDEENFSELRTRARQALTLLERQGENKSVIVTHHVFLKMLLAYMQNRDHLHAGDFAKLSYFNYSDNATVSIAEYHPWKIFSRSHGWKIVSYNEQPEALTKKIKNPT